MFPLIAVVLALSLPLGAETGALRGQVTDESGAVVPGAVVSLTGPAGLTKMASAGNDGSYSFAALPDGTYVVQASAPGLALREAAKVTVRAGAQTLNLCVHVVVARQQVTVEENGGPTVTTDPSNNASAVVISGSDLDALSDNPAPEVNKVR